MLKLTYAFPQLPNVLIFIFHICFGLYLQVFITLELYLRVCKMFECVRQGKEEGFVAKQGRKIDYDLLALGSLEEVRHVFARIVFDTVFPLHLSQDHRPR